MQATGDLGCFAFTEKGSIYNCLRLCVQGIEHEYNNMQSRMTRTLSPYLLPGPRCRSPLGSGRGDDSHVPPRQGWRHLRHPIADPVVSEDVDLAGRLR